MKRLCCLTNINKDFLINTFMGVFLLSHSAWGAHTLLPANKLAKIKHHYSSEVTQRFNSWDQLLADSQNKGIREKLELVNNFFNKMKWVEDKTLWKQRDYWATPIESLIRNAGDCEDFSIAKYFTLRALGIPNEQLKITYVEQVKGRQSHMVLAYYETNKSDPLILDNINKEIHYYSQRQDLRIEFGFNAEGLWLKNNKTSQPTADSNNILLWADLIKRMKKEVI